MILDGSHTASQACIDTDICIIGAGPAGLTLARELMHQRLRVCLLESGRLELDPHVQTLSQGHTSGDPFQALHESRRRQFGGLASAWLARLDQAQLGVRYAPLDPVDFQPREGMPYTGWPFGRDQLDPFYERAHRLCGLGPFRYEPQHWETERTPRLPLEGELFRTDMFQFGPSRVFTHTLRQELEKAQNVSVYLNANATQLETDPGARAVTGVQVASLNGNRFQVKARQVVLAGGGIENARLLLLSNAVQNAGLGNGNDLVGRFFMDHPLIRTGVFYPKHRHLFNQAGLYDFRPVDQSWAMGKLVITEAALKTHSLLQISALLLPRTPGNEGKKALHQLLASWRRRRFDRQVFGQVGKVMSQAHHLAAHWYRHHLLGKPLWATLDQGGWSVLDRKERRFVDFEVLSQTEQAPHPDNRVTLSKNLDPLGFPKAHLHWQWRETDWRSISKAQALLAQTLDRSGLGRLEVLSEGGKPVIAFPGTHHHMGTTRMHHDPKWGVVDPDCRVHGVENLFIAGSSVFPTGGYVNPTLTIVALSIRLADHLKGQLLH